MKYTKYSLMKRIYLVIVLFLFVVCEVNAQRSSPYTLGFNFDGYYDALTWGRWENRIYERYYTDKLFYIPKDASAGPGFDFKDQINRGEAGIEYAKNECWNGAERWHVRTFYTFYGNNDVVWSQRFIPTSVGQPINVDMHLYYWHEGSCDAGGFPSNDQWVFHSFKINVEKPYWYDSKSDFENICQDVNKTYNLADYFSVPGTTFNLDYAGDTTWQYTDFLDYTYENQVEWGLYHEEYIDPWTIDTIFEYPDFPNHTQEYQRANKMYTPHPYLITQLDPRNISPGVHTLLAMKTYDNGEYDASFGSHRATVLFPITITILQGAPDVGNVTQTASCPGAPNGTVTISGVSGGDGEYRYILRRGHGNNSLCDPEKGCFDDVAASGPFTGSSHTITGIPSGNYTLWIANKGGTVGGCAKIYNDITIGQLSVMDTLPIAIQHVSCPGGNNGFIHVTDTGGKAPYTYTLVSGSTTLTNNNGEFNSLPAGRYFMETRDGCDHIVARTIDLTEPLPVTITATASPTDCHIPANGAIDVNASGGSGTFDYYLYDNKGNTVSQLLGSTSATWRISAIDTGHYTVAVKNTLAAGCTATTQPVEILGPPALVIAYNRQTDNTCSYDAMGTLELSGSGGQSNGYLFFLQNTATGETLQSATGSFSNLPAASYKAWIRNRDISCLDSTIYASPINILAPPLLAAFASGTDITCNGRGDGTLQAVVGGGTPGYNLQWQQWDAQAGNCLTMSGRTGLGEN
jgi:hypothetical protein